METGRRRVAGQVAPQETGPRGVERGVALLRERAFHTAAPYLHAASWTAARAGDSGERLASQLRLADAQLHAREFHSALANYRYAERLAETIDPDSCTYWGTRAAIAQALRRVGRLEEARDVCRAVRRRLAEGALSGDPRSARLIASMSGNLEAQLEAMEGRYEAGAAHAVALARDFVAERDLARAAAQYYNASLWSLFAAEQAGAGWRTVHERGGSLAGLALDLLRGQDAGGDDETLLEVELLLLFVRVMGVKLASSGATTGVEPLLRAIADDIDRLRDGREPGSPSLRLGITLLALRVGERLGRAAVVRGQLRRIHQLVEEHRKEATLWVEQDLTARFRWERAAIPLAETDSALQEFLGARPA